MQGVFFLQRIEYSTELKSRMSDFVAARAAWLLDGELQSILALDPLRLYFSNFTSSLALLSYIA